MTALVHVPLEGNSLIARAPDGTLINLKATADGQLLAVDPTKTPNYNTAYSYSYDGLGRLSTQTTTVEGQSVTLTYAYDPVTGALVHQQSDLYPQIEGVISVAGKTGAVTLGPTDVGLPFVDNFRQEYYVQGGAVGEYLDGGGGLGSRQWRRLQSDYVAEGSQHLYFTEARRAELLALMGASAPVAVWYTQIFSNITSPATDGVRVAFPLDHPPGSAGHVDVAKNGLTLANVQDYNVVGSTLTFVVAPLSTDSIYARYGASLPVGTVAANAVSVSDTGAYYSGTDQEAVNEQVGRILTRMAAAFAILGQTINMT